MYVCTNEYVLTYLENCEILRIMVVFQKTNFWIICTYFYVEKILIYYKEKFQIIIYINYKFSNYFSFKLILNKIDK